MTIAGVALNLICVASAWVQAIPGPYDEPSGALTVAWLAAVVVVLAIFAATSAPTAVGGRPHLLWWAAIVIVIALPMVWTVPVRLAQRPPLSVQEAQPTAQVQLVRIGPVPVLGAAPSVTSESPDKPEELIGTVDVARPAPAGSHYELLAFDRRTSTALPIYSMGRRSGWNGVWSRVLPARYSWLTPVLGARDATGLFSSPHAVWADSGSGDLGFRMSVWSFRGEIAAEDVQVVLILVRSSDAYVFWATPVSSTSVTPSA